MYQYVKEGVRFSLKLHSVSSTHVSHSNPLEWDETSGSFGLTEWKLATGMVVHDPIKAEWLFTVDVWTACTTGAKPLLPFLSVSLLI